ncbi:MAG: glycosyltransferase family 4 protein [Bacteroidales bacterium]|nr:glycosyltransferase family 4 protein [Bacteroidales bacterium]
MRIAINVQTLVKDHLEGLGWFTYESIKRIVQAHPEHEFLLIFGKGIDERFVFSENIKAVNIGPPVFRPPAWYLKFEWLLPRFLNRQNIDLYISSDGMSSKKIKAKQLNIIHDLNFEANPQWLPKCFSFYYKKYFPIWTKASSRIATVSEYSKQDIHERYGFDLDKIDVVYNGSNALYQPIDVASKEATKQKYTSGSDYFVFVGSLHPRKNIEHLLLGFDRFKKNNTNSIKLVIVGSKYYWNGTIKEAFESMKFANDVIFTGHLPTEDLKNIVAASLALTYLSYFEGFGIPLVEAMSSETAIIASNATCLPEVAGDAALYVPPKDVTAIADAMQELVENPELRQKLIENGRQQRKNYSWDLTAQRLWQSVEKTLNV